MSSTTTATASPPKPVEAAARPAQAGARAPKDQPDGADIFSSLLNLLASTQVLPEASNTTGEPPPAASAEDRAEQNGPANPLTALMDWGMPGWSRTASTARTDGDAGGPGAAAANRPAPASGREGTIELKDMTAVPDTPVDAGLIDGAMQAGPRGTPALPANSPRAGASIQSAGRGTDTVTASTAWRHASSANSETVALQQAANQTAQAHAVRSTVALNERFGLTPGVPLAATDRRDVPVEGFNPSALASPGPQAAQAAALPGAVATDLAMGSDSAGSNNPSHDPTDAAADNPMADAHAGEEPEVTHWGTQHLRHASLRVGGEAGEQAIDIQLSMQGQEVQVAFMSESAEARALLRENAGASLADLLNRSGIQLGGVSVGAHGQPGSRRDDGAARPRGVTQVSNPTAADATRPTPSAPRADGSHPLDVFA